MLSLFKLRCERSKQFSSPRYRLNLPGGLETRSSPHACIDLQAIDRGSGISQPTQLWRNLAGVFRATRLAIEFIHLACLGRFIRLRRISALGLDYCGAANHALRLGVSLLLHTLGIGSRLT
ncbi:hypothetical protein PWG14_23690, partial [Chromobacterium amazonense]|uniref:hypothetical protein n=1 Tax=Chromobacterium amazonense TaxID=1382803 RepID=UPI00237E0BBD